MSPLIALLLLADGGTQGPVVGTGGLAKDVIAKVIRQNQGQVKFCYDQELAKNAKLVGKLAVKFSIGPDGKVQSADVEGSDLPASMNECVRGRVLAMKFPEPSGGGVVTVTFPWVFKQAE